MRTHRSALLLLLAAGFSIAASCVAPKAPPRPPRPPKPPRPPRPAAMVQPVTPPAGQVYIFTQLG